MRLREIENTTKESINKLNKVNSSMFWKKMGKWSLFFLSLCFIFFLWSATYYIANDNPLPSAEVEYHKEKEDKGDCIWFSVDRSGSFGLVPSRKHVLPVGSCPGVKK